MNLLKRALLVLVFPGVTLVATVPSVSAVEVGEKAPNFELRSTMGGKLKLSSLQGKNVLIQFYVIDFSPG